jgi:hypothetical protein
LQQAVARKDAKVGKRANPAGCIQQYRHGIRFADFHIARRVGKSGRRSIQRFYPARSAQDARSVVCGAYAVVVQIPRNTRLCIRFLHPCGAYQEKYQ